MYMLLQILLKFLYTMAKCLKSRACSICTFVFVSNFSNPVQDILCFFMFQPKDPNRISY